MFTENQKVWVKVPATEGVDDHCWIAGRVIKTTDKRVKVRYECGIWRETYQAPHNVKNRTRGNRGGVSPLSISERSYDYDYD